MMLVCLGLVLGGMEGILGGGLAIIGASVSLSLCVYSIRFPVVLAWVHVYKEELMIHLCWKGGWSVGERAS